MNKTLYVKDEGGQIWDKARELTGDKLSNLIMEKLRAFVNENECKKHGYDRIVLRFYENGIPKAKAFYGRWIIEPGAPFVVPGDGFDEPDLSYAVAATQKGNYVVLEFIGISLSPDEFDDGAFMGADFWGLESLEGNTNHRIPATVRKL